jgi:hypothetical protein
MQALAEKADSLMALHLPQQHDVAAIPAEQQEQTDESGDVAAINGRSSKKGKKKPFKKQTGKQRKGTPTIPRTTIPRTTVPRMTFPRMTIPRHDNP